MFRTGKQREVHMRNCTADGVRVKDQCPVPGCEHEHADKAIYHRHVRACWKTYEWKSPVCQACGVCYTNQELNPRTRRFELRDYRAKAYWQRHANLYKQTRQVDCQRCGAPHLMPWCAITPKQKGRHFQCSDNYFDLQMGSAQCRRSRPGDPPPRWATRQPDSEGDDSEEDGSTGTVADNDVDEVQNDDDSRVEEAAASNDDGGGVYDATTEDSTTTDEGEATADNIVDDGTYDATTEDSTTTGEDSPTVWDTLTAAAAAASEASVADEAVGSVRL